MLARRLAHSRKRGHLPTSGVLHMEWVWFLFRFEGRINRAKYWLATLIILGCMIFALSLLAGISAAFGIGGHGFAIDLFGIGASIELNDDAPASANWFPWLVTIPM